MCVASGDHHAQEPCKAQKASAKGEHNDAELLQSPAAEGGHANLPVRLQEHANQLVFYRSVSFHAVRKPSEVEKYQAIENNCHTRYSSLL